MTNSKRHHYVPEFLLRRFATEDSKGKNVWCLDVKTGKTYQVRTRNTAVIKHHNRMIVENGEADVSAEAYLADIDAEAAEAVTKMEKVGHFLSDDERLRFAYFVHLSGERTPRNRAWQKEDFENTKEFLLRVAVKYPGIFTAVYRRAVGENATEEEAEKMRQELLGDFDSGSFTVPPDFNAEVQQMFLATRDSEEGKNLAELISERLGWAIARPGRDDELILSDAPLGKFDPTPPALLTGAGYISSPNAMTYIPLDPSFGLLLEQRPYRWLELTPDKERVEFLRCLTFCQAYRYVYGTNRDVLNRTWKLVSEHPQIMNQLKPRPPKHTLIELPPIQRGEEE